MKARLIPMDIRDFRDNWEEIRGHLAAIIHRCKADFLPEDVYREVTTGRVYPYAIYSGKAALTMIGFTIMSEHTDKYSGAKILSLDMTYIEPNTPYLPAVADALRNFAAEHEKDRIEWFSPRRGWDHKLTEIGFKSDSMLFVTEVPHG